MELLQLTAKKVICTLTEEDFNAYGIKYPDPVKKENMQQLLDAIKASAFSKLNFNTSDCRVSLSVPKKTNTLLAITFMKE